MAAVVSESFDALAAGAEVSAANTALDSVTAQWSGVPAFATNSPSHGGRAVRANVSMEARLEFTPRYQWPTALDFYNGSPDIQGFFPTYEDFYAAMIDGGPYSGDEQGFLATVGYRPVASTTVWLNFTTEPEAPNSYQGDVHSLGYFPMSPDGVQRFGFAADPFAAGGITLRPWLNGTSVSGEGVVVAAGTWYRSVLTFSDSSNTATVKLYDAAGAQLYSYTFPSALQPRDNSGMSPHFVDAVAVGPNYTENWYVDDFGYSYEPYAAEGGGGDPEEPEGPVDRPIPLRHLGRDWRYIVQRLDGNGGGTILDWDAPLEDVELEDLLSGHNGLTAKISPVTKRLIADDGLPLIDSNWNTAIWAEKDGQIRGGGIVTNVTMDGPEFSVEAVDLSGYAMDMPYTDAWFGVKIDPLDVVRHIWEHIQSQPGGNVGLELGDLKTGIKIGVRMEQGDFDPGAEGNPGNVTYYDSSTYKLAWYQDHDLAGNIDKLAEDTPFDYHVRHWWDGETIRHKMEFAYPRMGKKRTGLRFVFGENIHEVPSVERTGETYATEVLMLGAGEGRKMKRGSAFRSREGLRRVAVVSDSSLRTQKGVNRRAESELKWRSGLDEVSEIVVVNTPHAPLGTVEVGDVIRIQGRTDWKQIDMEVRVVQITTRPDDGETAVYTVQRTDAQIGGGQAAKVNDEEPGGTT